MKNLKPLLFFLLGSVFFAGIALAAPSVIYQTTLLPTPANNADLGTTTNTWRTLYVNTASTTNLTISGINGSTQCLTISSTGVVTGTGGACAASAFPWTAATNYTVNTNSTTTPIWLKSPTNGSISFMASSTAALDKLTVASTTATSTFSTGGITVGTNQFVIQQTSGNVGVGTTSPTNLFSVNGYMDVSGLTGGYKFDGNKFIYASSTNFATVMGIGAGTGLDATSTWTQDTAIGYQALNGTIAAGSPVGGNTAVGYFALKSRTSGPANTAVGANALKLLTTGNNDIAVGNSALAAQVGGVNDVAIGASVMGNFTSGNGNTAVGGTAMSGAASASGNFNVAIGQNAVQGLSSGQRNVGIGRNTGFSITSGSNNIFIGAESSTTATGSNNIALGYDIALPSVNGSNQLDIGNLIFGTSINGEGPTLSTGSVGIGTTTPIGKLHVSKKPAGDGTVATTTFTIGEIGTTTSVGCFNTQNTAGSPVSFYFVGTTQIIEPNLCR